MRGWARLHLLFAGALGACAGGENSVGDNFTFGGGDGDGGSAEGDPTVGGPGATSMADGTAGQDGNDDNDDNADGVACIDGDGDGYGDGCAAGEDCDDTQATVNPGSGETCDGVDENCDGMVDNGCDCPEDGVSGACNSPTDLGVIDPGGSTMSVVGTVPQEGALDWYAVSFPTAARPGEGTPTISFAINSGDAFVFDVVANECDVEATTCTEGGTAGAGVGLTSWSFADTDPGCCAPPQDSLVAWPNQVFVRVYRTTVGASCDTYQLQASR